MKPTRNKLPPRTPKTPGRVRQENNFVEKDPVEVYCRLRSVEDNEKVCMQVLSSSVVCVIPPEGATNYRANVTKETQYMFKHVFVADSTQKEVFDRVGRGLVEGLVKGKNGLLFTYGVTGSGKTYTMTGDGSGAGIMPRAINLLFNNITTYQAEKYVFKADGLNGFDIQTELDALQDRRRDAKEKFTRNGKLIKKTLSDPSLGSSSDDNSVKLEGIEEDNTFSVFISYVEIYNNGVYDLLEESNQRCLQNKIIREDCKRNMFVHGVVEIEVKTPSEAFDLFYTGQKRKRMAHTELNAESSRSHSIFTVRLVQAPVDQKGEHVILNKNLITVSQLSLVDLAGSERSNRTKNTGVRLKEASSINSSLLTLRNCLEVLRENQTNGETRMVPYRESKLTHLFKNFFEGEGHVRMIVCVNPRIEDYDESIHVMKFAEMTQDVQIARPTPMKIEDPELIKGRRKVNQLFKIAINHLTEENKARAEKEIDYKLVYNMGVPLPPLRLTDPEADDIIKKIILNLEFRIAKRKEMLEEFQSKQDQYRQNLLEWENESMISSTERSSLRAVVHQSENKITNMEQKLMTLEAERHQLFNQIDEKNEEILSLKVALSEKEMLLGQATIEKEKQKKKLTNKFEAQNEKITHEFEQKLREHQDRLKLSLREKDQKLRLVQQILDTKTPVPSTSTLGTQESRTEIRSVKDVERKENQMPYCTPRRVGTGVELRHRRSRSVGNDKWLEHRSALATPLGTLMQPQMKKIKTLTKLTDAKYVTDKQISKYCLISQEADTDGEVETCVYKADVLPTTGGGAQVIFSDVEKLKQASPTQVRKRRSNPSSEDLASRCSIGIEGHNLSKRSKV